MAHFYASVRGTGKTEASKSGTKKTGMIAHVRGWDIGARVVVEHVDGKDMIRVYKTRGTNGDNGGRNDELVATIVDGERTIVRVPDEEEDMARCKECDGKLPKSLLVGGCCNYCFEGGRA